MSNDTLRVILIPLTQDQVTAIDEADADLLRFKWCASRARGYAGGGKFRAMRNLPRNSGSQRTELLHRVILSRILGRPLLSHEIVDHVNGDPLDNRRKNLRLATKSQNAMNAGRHYNNSSGYKGVSYFKPAKKWKAEIQENKRRVHLGYFATPEEAYDAYCKAACELHGEFANVDKNEGSIGNEAKA